MRSETLELISEAIWIAVHVVGAVVMLSAWRRYRQSFFPWSSLKWATQAGVVWLAPTHGLALVLVRLTGAFAGVVAVYLTLRMMRRQRRFVLVVAADERRAMLRRGVDNHVMSVPPPDADVDEDAVDTPRVGMR